MTRREASKVHIREAVLIFCDSRNLDPRDLQRVLSDADKKTLLRIVSKHYPFGQRDCHPYKVWLSEVKVFKEWLFFIETPITEGLFA